MSLSVAFGASANEAWWRYGSLLLLVFAQINMLIRFDRNKDPPEWLDACTLEDGTELFLTFTRPDTEEQRRPIAQVAPVTVF